MSWRTGAEGAPSRYSAAGVLDAVAGFAPSELVGPGPWERARAVAGWLPAALGEAFYLECRLGARSPQVDWIVRVDGPGRDILAARNPVLGLPAPLREDEAWVRLAEFCAAWADDPLLRRVVSHLWLEFDLEHGEKALLTVPRPSLFVGFAAGEVADLGAEAWWRVLGRIVDVACPGRLPFPAAAALRGVVALRPQGSTIPYFGLMLARPLPAVRLYLGRVAAAALPEDLRRAGWPGEPAELAAALGTVGPEGAAAPEPAMVHLEVHEEVLPRVGVEYGLRRRDAGPAEAAFLKRLVEAGLCTRSKRRALEAWAGFSDQVLRHELWSSRMTRRVNHVKLLCQPGLPPDAKGYLKASWRPVRGAAPPGVAARV